MAPVPVLRRSVYFRLAVDVLDLSDQVEREAGQDVFHVQEGIPVFQIEHPELQVRIDSAAGGKGLAVEGDLLGEHRRSRIVHRRVGEVQMMPSVAHEDLE